MKPMSISHLFPDALKPAGIATAFLLNAFHAGAQDIFIEPPLPVHYTMADQGYFPTTLETPLLRGPSDARSTAGGQLNDAGGPDLRAQTATGIFPYEDPQPNFYQRNPGIFKPLDYSLGWLTPNDALTREIDPLDNTSLTLDARAGILTRQFSPELAMLKAGPLYFDLLWVGAGITWSDFAGNRDFDRIVGERNGDGAIAYIDLGIRGLVRFTDTLYLSVVGNLMYLPFENEVALRLGNGQDSGLTARLNYAETIGDWNVLAYNEFLGRPGLNWYGQGTVDAADRAGRYFYGFQTRGPANEFYNENFVFFSNRMGLSANRLVFDNQWRLFLAVDHTDYWRSFNFDDHSKREHAGISLGYEGTIIPFAPRISYDVYSMDGFDSMWHRAYLDLTGRVTENISWSSRVGYSITTGSNNELDQFLWQIGLDHNITKNTRQWIRIGEGIFDNEVNAESLTSRFLSWGLGQRLGSKLYFETFVQLADSETIVPTMEMRERLSSGVTLRYQPLDFTQISASALYENIDPGSPAQDSDRWMYRSEIIQQLGLRLTGQLYYQYEVNDAEFRAFQEHVVGMTLKRYF
jgi:hypothetical protein